MEKCSTYLGLKLVYSVFVSTEQLTITLQAKNINVQVCIESGHTAKNFLLRHRSSDYFDIFYRSVITESEDLTDTPALPRKKEYRNELIVVVKVILFHFQKNTSDPSI